MMNFLNLKKNLDRPPGLGAAGLQVMIFPLISYNNFKQDMYLVNEIRKIKVYILSLLGRAGVLM